MKERILVTFLILCTLQIYQITCQYSAGKLFLIGGSLGNNTKYIFSKLRETTGRNNPKVAVLMSALPKLFLGEFLYFVNETNSPSYEEWFISNGFQPAYVQLASDNCQIGASNKTDIGWQNIELIRNADIVFLNGGDLSYHLRTWLNNDGSDTDILTVLREKFAQGTVIAGLSAGMDVVGEYAHGFGTSYGCYYYNDLKYCNIGDNFEDDRDSSDKLRGEENGVYSIGFRLLRDALTDAHFDRTGRLARLLVAMTNTGVTHGLGINEETALYIDNNIATVYGSWGVWILDTSKSTIPANETHFSIYNVRVHYLTDGDTYNFNLRHIQSSKSVIPFQEAIPVPTSYDIFGDNEALDSIKSLIRSNLTVIQGYSNEEDPTCIITFQKDNFTEGYFSNGLYTIVNLLLHVKTETSE